jgi:hypothetical protein
MTAFAEYAQKYKTVRTERRNGILQLALQPTLQLRHTGVVFTECIERQMQDLLGYGPALEGMALMEKPLPPQAS